MQLSETIKLYMSQEEKILVTSAMNEYIRVVNDLVSLSISGTAISRYTTADVDAKLPSALTNQCIRDAKSIVKNYNKKYKLFLKNKENNVLTAKEPKVPILRKQCCYINNQNFKIDGEFLSVPVFKNGKTIRIKILTSITNRQQELFSNAKLGTMRIILRNNKIVAQIIYEVVEPKCLEDGNIMGIDLGLKCPAVSYISNGSVRFYGSGRKNKYIRRHYKCLREQLSKEHKIKAIEKIGNKEQRIMKDIDHKISRDIINEAISHNVKIIKMEYLGNVRSKKSNHKNNYNLFTWSFYRLSQFIEYKARLAGIKVEYIKPAYTSQRCPVCGAINHAKDRDYACKCGFHIHRDLLGAINICYSSEYIGNRDIRYTA